ncbi:MAG: hypothetical protein HYV09_24505 [Deltaproteobacteria bacterium]|nr:hypothetical protein [Deltaproteobacteria bacterium]
MATLSAMILVGGGAAGCARHRGPPAARVARTTSTTRALQTAPVIVQPAPTAVGGGPSGDEVRAEGPQRLDAARVERSIEARKDRLRNECFAPEEGVVSFIIDLQVAPDGRVERAKTRSVDGSHDVAECVRARLEKTSFPPSVEGGTHSVTFHFGR